MFLPLIIYSFVLCFSTIGFASSTNSNNQQICNVSCQTLDESCESKINYYFCLKTKTGGTDIDCDQQLNDTQEFICEHCDWTNSYSLTKKEVEKTMECSKSFLNDDKILGMQTPIGNCRKILDYLECRSKDEVKCKNSRGKGRPPSYRDLHEMAFKLCSGANGSLYTTCDRFLEEYKKIFVVEGFYLLQKLSDPRWWCQCFKRVLVAAGIEITSEVDCETLAYDSLSKNMSLKYQANWTEYCYMPQDGSPTSSTLSPSSSYISPTSRSSTIPSTDSGTVESIIYNNTEINKSVKITERNGGEQNIFSGYFCLLAFILAAVILK